MKRRNKRIVVTYTGLDVLQFTDSASFEDLIAAVASNIDKIASGVLYRKQMK